MINFDNYFLVKIGLAIFGFLIVFPVCHFWLKYRNELRECRDKLKRQEKRLSDWQEVFDKYTHLKLLNKELLEALHLIKHATAPTHNDGGYHEAAYDIACAAILKVKE